MRWPAKLFFAPIAKLKSGIQSRTTAFKSSGIATLNLFLGWLMMSVAGIWILVLAFQEDAVCGVLCLLVPFYSLYFVITRFDECKVPFVLELFGFVLWMTGSIAAVAHA